MTDLAARILVVDDSVVNRKLLERLLTQESHTVETASDGRAALARIAFGQHELKVAEGDTCVIEGTTAAEPLIAAVSGFALSTSSVRLPKDISAGAATRTSGTTATSPGLRLSARAATRMSPRMSRSFSSCGTGSFLRATGTSCCITGRR